MAIGLIPTPKAGGGNMALAFAALVAGGVLIDYAHKSLNGAFTSSASTSTTATSTTATTGANGNNLPVTINNSGYTNPLQHVTNWERTDQGVDANMPVGAPIVAPGKVQILGVEPDWYNGQPFIYWKLLDGPDAGQVQYVAEQITNLAPVNSVLQAGQPIANYAASGTGIEYGWATASGQTLAMATTGYTEGYATTAGKDMRVWLNSLGAGAGTGAGLSIGAGADPDDAAKAIAAELRAFRNKITTPGYVGTDSYTADPDNN